MKWEDTVKLNPYDTFLEAKHKYLRRRNVINDIGGHTEEAAVAEGCKEIAKTQAEVSYKAGIKKVVEWIKEKERMTESVGVSPNTKHITVYAIDDDEWQQFMESIGE